MSRSVWRRFVLIALLLAIAGCKKGNQFVPPPPPKVSVATPVADKIDRYLEATGSIAAVASVDLTARVSGFLTDIHYTDGAFVKAGDALFTIEQPPYQARLQQAQAAEAGARAQLTNALSAFARQEALQRQSVASVQNLDDARAQRDTAQSNLLQAQANTQIAAINYTYTRIVAPFDGRVTAHLASVGELVGQTPTKLATIVQMNPVHVVFTVSEQDVQRIRADTNHRVPSRAEGYPHKGHLDYLAPLIDTSTGTLTARGVLDNGERLLLPGYFARVRVPIQTGVAAMLLPDAALGGDQGGRYVLVVGADNVVAQQYVTTGPLWHGLRVIEAGLKPDMRVVVSGLQRAVPGQAVDPATVTIAAGQP
jgi:RND family efflux transporter MFP subunit